MDFEFIESEKLGGDWFQAFAVVRKKVVYLRIVGNGKDYRVMTATVGEDVGGYRICQYKERLWEAAIQLAKAHNCAAVEEKDRNGRVYVQLFTASQGKGDSDEIFTDELKELIAEFFVIYDSLDDKSKLSGM